MGSLVKVACSACSYGAEISIGGTRFDFQTHCGFPALCTRCRAVVESNHLAALSCPDCAGDVTSYSDVVPVAEAGGPPVITEDPTWDDEEEDEDEGKLTLAQGAYPCPRCSAPQLRFSDTGMCID